MRTAVRIGMRLAVSVAAFWLALSLVDGFSGLKVSAPAADWLLLAAALHLAILAVITWRWRMLLKVVAGGARISFGELAVINWIGLGVGQVALGTLSGDAMRVIYAQRATGSWSAATRAVLIDRLMGLLGLALIVVVALAAATGAGFAAMSAAAGVMVLALGWMEVFVFRTRLGPIIQGTMLAPLLSDLRGIAGSRAGWLGLCLTIAGHLMNVCVFYAASRAFGLFPDPAATFVAVPGGIFGSALPISLGGWGVRELSVAVLYDFVGAPFPNAILASVLFGFSHVAMGLPGLVFLLIKTRGIIGPIGRHAGEDP